MSLSQKSRVALYQGLSGVIPDEDAVEESCPSSRRGISMSR